MGTTPWTVDRWLSEVRAGLTGLRELDPEIPTRLVYGGDLRGRLSFGLISRRSPDLPPLSSAVEVSRVRREHDQSWLLLFTLDDQALADVFAQLCGQIYAKVSGESTADAGLARALASIEEWRLLLKSDQRKLSIEKIRGLYAELTFAFDLLAPRAGVKSVVEAWQGPYGGDQDFGFPQGRYEVKSKRATSRAVEIASEYQLAGDDIVLAIGEVVDSTIPFEGALTLGAKLRAIRSLATLAGASLEAFEDALGELRIDPDDACHDDVYLLCKSFDYYLVTDSFPRITSSELPGGVTNVRYKLDIDGLTPYRIDEEAAFAALRTVRTNDGR
ncbi:PD-(D/E)XK motif protein [Arthrobacter zhaoguopingii]|uniref:PD-(D/E)XK motif protein n=1 Tax=Arthrobacter zhaoguopingii TaxID=2681491 RepID=UPI001357D2A7|nr:PD-(D/E)XK motif protein [Arthrobacter zhaoguopingii]